MIFVSKPFLQPKGICLVTQPLTSIMNDKKQNDVCNVAVLSMKGDLSGSLADANASLSCLLDDLMDGKYPVIIGHPESFDTQLGQQILKELHRQGMIILVCIDEFHQSGDRFWDSFRPSMMRSSTSLRMYGVKNCPVICMTATATEADVDMVVTSLGLRSKPVVLTASPILSHIKFSVIRLVRRRPYYQSYHINCTSIFTPSQLNFSLT